MNKELLLRTLEYNFTAEWKRHAGRLDYKVVQLLNESFLFDEMVESLNRDSNAAVNKALSLRYQRFILRSLSRQFALQLYIVSKGGKEINQVTIRRAQENLKKRGKCPMMPCIKPKINL